MIKILKRLFSRESVCMDHVSIGPNKESKINKITDGLLLR